MRSCSVWAATGILLLAASGWAAEAGRANIPFSFHVGGTELNAGEYDILVGQPNAGTITVRSRSTDMQVYSPKVFFDRRQNESAPEAKLVFNKYGEDEYFLSEIWSSWQNSSIKLSKCQHESVTSKFVARLTPEKVIIAMRIR